LPLGGCIKAVAEEVQKHPGHLLRRQLGRCKVAVELALELAESSGEPQQRFEALYGCGSQLAITRPVV
jgi:hypothetical protein